MLPVWSEITYSVPGPYFQKPVGLALVDPAAGRMSWVGFLLDEDKLGDNSCGHISLWTGGKKKTQQKTTLNF